MPPKESSILRTAGGDSVSEKLSWTYYDTQLIAAAAVLANTPWTFFVSAQGQAGNGFAVKNRLHTNMVQPSQLPANHRFVARAINLKMIHIVAAGPVWSTTGDALQIINGSDFSFNLVAKEKLAVPCVCIPAGSSVMDGGAAAVAVPINGMALSANAYWLKQPIVLEAVQTFNVVITQRQGTAVNISTPVWLQVSLLGTLYRPAQ